MERGHPNGKRTAKQFNSIAKFCLVRRKLMLANSDIWSFTRQRGVLVARVICMEHSSFYHGNEQKMERKIEIWFSFCLIEGIFGYMDQSFNMKLVGHKSKFWETKTMQIVHGQLSPPNRYFHHPFIAWPLWSVWMSKPWTRIYVMGASANWKLAVQDHLMVLRRI